MGTETMPVYALAMAAYVDAGWPSVLPLPPGKKTPPPAGCTGAVASDPTPEQMAAWAELYPDANVGLRCPDQVIGIDIDDYGRKVGWSELQAMAAEYDLGELPPTWVSTARPWDGVRQSGIRWYRVPGRRRWVSQFCPAVEIVQRAHRYGVVWPSVHPEGGVYRWLEPGGKVADTGIVPRLMDLAILPAKWVDALCTVEDAEAGASAKGRVPARSRERATRTAALEWLADRDLAWPGWSWDQKMASLVRRAVDKARAGTRHDAMLWATAMVVGDVAKGDLPGAAVLDMGRAFEKMYEQPVESGLVTKDPKPWAGPKEQDFWSQVEGAVAKYADDGSWFDRVKASVKAEQVMGWAEELAKAEAVDQLVAEAELAVAEAGVGEEGGVSDEGPVGPEPEPARPETDLGPGESGASEASSGDEEPADGEAGIGDDRGHESATGDEWAAVSAGPGAGGELLSREEQDEVDRLFRDLLRRELEAMAGLDGWAGEAVVMAEALGLGARVDKPANLTGRRIAELREDAERMVANRRHLDTSWHAEVGECWIEDWLPKAALVTLIAAPSVGKSALAVDMALRIAAGLPWQGEHVDGSDGGARVMYLAYEAGEAVRARVAAWVQAHRPELDAGVAAGRLELRADGTPTRFFSAQKIGLSIASRPGRDLVREWLAETWGPGDAGGVIVVDTLAAGFVGEENETGAMAEFVRGCYELMAERPDVTFLVLHHPTKEASRTQFPVTGRGSGVLGAAADVELVARRLEEADEQALGGGPDAIGWVELRRAKNRQGETEGAKLAMLEARTVVGADGRPLVKGSGARVRQPVVVEAGAGELEVLAAAQVAKTTEQIAAAQTALRISNDRLVRAVWQIVDELAAEKGGAWLPKKSHVYRREGTRMTWASLGLADDSRHCKQITEDMVGRVLDAGRPADGAPCVFVVEPKGRVARTVAKVPGGPTTPSLADGYVAAEDGGEAGEATEAEAGDVSAE